MKSLQESLFDKDIIEKDLPGHRLKDITFFDGQWVLRLPGDSELTMDGKKNGALHVIDWKKVRKDVKLFGGEKIDLGLYSYANASNTNIRTAATIKQTELFARLIMSIPFFEECRFGSFNSRFRDEMCQKLDQYILSEWRGQKTGLNGNTNCHFDVSTSKWTIAIYLEYGPWGNTELARWEFEKNIDR